MEFTFSDEQRAMRDAVSELVQRETPIAVIREHLETAQPAGNQLWSVISQLGWQGLLVPTQFGGIGSGPIVAVAVAEVLGATLHGGPMLAAGMLAPWALVELDATSLLSSIIDDARRCTVAFEEAGAADPVDRISTMATGRGNDYRLNGVKVAVIDGHLSDSLIVSARSREGVRAFLVDPGDAELRYTPSLDLTRKTATLRFVDTPARPIGCDGDQTSQWRRINAFGALLLAAEMVGVAASAHTLALQYATTREVFGKPLSKFQVTRHKAVDVLREIELARVGVHAAAWQWSQGFDSKTASAISMAKSFSGEAANHSAAECIQIHGAMGYTWDCDAHLFLRRAKTNDILFGTQSWHRNQVADRYLASL